MISMRIVAAATALAMATSANASIMVSAVVPGTNPYSGPAPTYDFDSASGTPSFTGGAVVTGSTTSHAQPFGSTGGYFSVGPDDGTPGTIDLSSFGDIFTVSLLWGSVDSYNLLEFLDASNNVLASFGGTAIFNPANGNQTSPNTNPWVLFTLSGTDVAALSSVRLTSNTNAFEIDNMAINAVPEPGTWAMMLLGFGAIGFAMRRRATPKLAQLA